MEGIDTASKDRGLVQCLKRSKVESELIILLTDSNGNFRWDTIDSFYYWFNSDDLQNGIEKVLQAFAKYKRSDNPERPNYLNDRMVSALRQAWWTAKRLVSDLEATPPDADVDWEAPLPPGTHDDLNRKFTARYDMRIRPEQTPDEPTVTRYYRAFTKNKNSMKLLKAEQHKAMGTTTGLPLRNQVETIHDYYNKMKIMAFALAKAGNHTFQCKTLGEVINAPLDTNLMYAEESYERALRRGSLQWLRERDEMTRTQMIWYFKQGYSQGCALDMARKFTEFHWQDHNLFKDRLQATSASAPSGAAPIPIEGEHERGRFTLWKGAGKKKKKPRHDSRPSGAVLRSVSRSRSRGRSPEKGKGKSKGRGRGKGSKDSPRPQAVNYNLFCPNIKGNRACQEWEEGKRCKERPCKSQHGMCNRRLHTGGACLGNHPANKCTNPNRVIDPNRRSPEFIRR